MDFIIKNLLDIKDVKNTSELLHKKDTDKYILWLDDNFQIEYGQINWKNVANYQRILIDGIPDNDIKSILSGIIVPSKTYIAIWSDINEGLKIIGDTIIKYHNKMFYPVKSDLWLIAEDYTACIEFHHESYLGFFKL